MWRILRLLHVISAKLLKRKLCLSDAGDVDGIVSATLFKMKYPDGVVILAHPPEVRRSLLLRSIAWDFIADLPCPPKAKIRADHHVTNKPCADVEFYDPGAPCAAVLALRALGLENNPEAVKLVSIASETDTANIKTKDAEILNLAVKVATYRERLKIIEKLATEGTKAIYSNLILNLAEKGLEKKKTTEEFSEKIMFKCDTLILVFKKDLKLWYRYLSYILEKNGIKFVCIIVPKSLFTLRVYLGSRRDSPFDCARIAEKLGGGGHRVAAGASVRAFLKERKTKEIVTLIMDFIKREKYSVNKIKVISVNSQGELKEIM